jgi:hypothetical protein
MVFSSLIMAIIVWLIKFELIEFSATPPIAKVLIVAFVILYFIAGFFFTGQCFFRHAVSKSTKLKIQ